MNEVRALQLTLVSEAGELRRLRAAVRAWCADDRWSENQIGEIVLAVDEAVTNVIRHSYLGAADQRIEVEVRSLGEIPGVEIRIRDFGPQVDPSAFRGRALDDIRPGGLGLHLMRAMMSSIAFQPAEGGGMLAILRKHRSHTVEARSTLGTR